MSPFQALLLSAIFSVTIGSSITDYAPTPNVICPNTTIAPLLRVFDPANQTLNPREEQYISAHGTGAWGAWIGDGQEIGYNASLFEGKWSNMGIAFSGGGYRASLYGAGVLNALDARNGSAKEAGTGGLLQAASYVSGLSGGSWLVGSMTMNNWPTATDLVYGNNSTLSGWLLDLNLVIPGGINIRSQENQLYYDSILGSVSAKAETGINISVTDPWSRMISYHFLNQTDYANFFTNDSPHGAGQLWSDMPNLPAYEQALAPFPLVVFDSKPAGLNATNPLPIEPVVYEMSPLEFGSYDPQLSAMANATYVGTSLLNGQPANGSSCVTGFDEAGFVMGTSSNLFNSVVDVAQNKISGFSSSDREGLLYILSRELANVQANASDVAVWPNPFRGLNPGVFLDSDAEWLELIDGGSNLENIPLDPLFVKSRNVDIIVAVDASSDQGAWPNGTAMVYDSLRIKTLLLTSHQDFPPIPDSADAFVATGTNARPTFFGCDPLQMPPDYPLVVYLPNSPPLNGSDPSTNTNTFKLTYTPIQVQVFLDQVFMNTIGGFVPGSLGADPNWSNCLKCAAVDRARLRVTPALARSDICTQCFRQYCFDPAHPPSKSELVGRKLQYQNPDPQRGTNTGIVVARRKKVIIGAVMSTLGLVMVVL